MAGYSAPLASGVLGGVRAGRGGVAAGGAGWRPRCALVARSDGVKVACAGYCTKSGNSG